MDKKNIINLHHSDPDSNKLRTKEYLKRFNRQKTLKYLIDDVTPIIFDLGANDGASTDEFKKWWPDSTVHSFEPQEECWFEFNKVLKIYNDGSVIFNKIAVGNESTDNKKFYTHDINTGLSGFNKINTKSSDSIDINKLRNDGDIDKLKKYRKSFNNERTVQVIRLDDYMNDNDIDLVNLVKMDCQGFEPEILEGFGNRLSDVQLVVTELMFYDLYERSLSFSDIEKFLLPKGFQLYDISHIAKNPMNGRTDWVDVLYLNTNLIL